MLDVVLRLLHPTMPFVTEVLWQALTNGDKEDSIMIAPWPTAADTNGGASTDEVAVRRIDDSEKLITELRRFRANGVLSLHRRFLVASTLRLLICKTKKNWFAT